MLKVLFAGFASSNRSPRGLVEDSMVWCKSLTRRLPCGSWRAAGDGLRSGPGDSDPNDGPAARFAAEAARYGIVVNGLFVASRPCLRWAAQRPRRF